MSGHNPLRVSCPFSSISACSRSVGMDLAAHSAIIVANSFNHCRPSAEFKRALSAAIDSSLTLSCVGGFRFRAGLASSVIHSKSTFRGRMDTRRLGHIEFNGRPQYYSLPGLILSPFQHYPESMKIFYSWQSDTPKEVGKEFVRQALDAAVSGLEINESERPVVDQDTAGVLGSPIIAETIFRKIRESSVIVVDVTLTGKTASNKPLINSNVAIELGYAIGVHGE